MRSVLILVFIALVLNLIPTFVFAQEEMEVKDEVVATKEATPVDSYAMFWPVAAGKVMGESMYSLKLFKESIGEFLSFGDLKKTEFNITLSEKRTVEAEKLFMTKKDYQNGDKTLKAAKDKREKALKLLKQAENSKRNVTMAKGQFITSLTNQQTLLSYIEAQVPNEQKQAFKDSLDQIKSLLSQIQ